MATIKDIAKTVGMSITTVSRALNGYDDVSDATRQLIIEAAKQLNYVPNRAAQNLVKKNNRTLAIILSGLEEAGGKDNIVYRLLSGMYAFADTIDYEVVLYTTSTAHQKKKSYVQFCREQNISGAVINGIRLDDPYLKEIIESGMPCVLIDVELEADNISYITINNVKAATEAVTCLIEHGHRHIAFLNGRKEADVSIKRQIGYETALKQNQIPLNEAYILYADFIESNAYECIKTFIKAHPEVTAIFAASDMMALGAIKAIRSLGMDVPKDISIIGFDDIPFAEYLNPALGTVQQDFYLMGYYAGKQLVQMIQGKNQEKKIIIGHKVLARDTVAML